MPFKHQPLNLGKAQIRLFRLIPGEPLVGTISIHDLENCPRFTAVSYTWGPSYPTREISLDGQSLIVRENLWQFLSVMRDRPERWLWIDQICIDQSAVDERNHQVSLMATIYAKAAGVVIWLGTEADGSAKAMKAIDSGFTSARQHELQVQALFQRPYWERLWILQEVIMGRNILILCGNQSLPWKKLEDCFIPRVGSTDGPWHPVEINDIALSLIEDKASIQGKTRRLSYILQAFAQLRCEDVRDKVYGLLSLVRSSGAIPVDYAKTPTEVFFNAVQRIVEDESFIEFTSHLDVARHLRDQMMLADVDDLRVSSFVRKQLDMAVPPIWHATARGDEAAVKLLLAKSEVDIDSKDSYGRTPLLLAAKDGHEAVVKLLLAAGTVDIDSKDGDGQTPLSWSTRKGHEAIAKLLLRTENVDIDSKDSYGRTPLSWAAQNGHEGVVKLLLATGTVDIDSKDGDGRTPLSRAAEKGCETVVRLLLATGKVDIDSKDSYGRTPLLLAAKNGYEAVVKLLLATGMVDIDSKDGDGRTPLSRAAGNGREAVVKLLLATDKVSIDSKDRNGRTALSQAAEKGLETIVKLLLATGKVDIDSKDTNNGTPLSWADEKGREKVVKLLKSYDTQSL